MNHHERNQHAERCPHCGAWAEWSFLSSEKSQIEVMCPDCGRYKMDREEFDQAVTDISKTEEFER
ncbi:MAG TPA: hypothetical protein VH640_28900 [Bryobacteraceae bacterium]|jgi:Zn-finger nucleic acid-binding protein